MQHPDRDAEPLDVLGQFSEVPEDNPIPGRRGILLTSVGFVGLAVLGSVGFVSGAVWGSAHEPDLDYGNLAAEIAIKIGYAALWGALVAAVFVALALAVVGWFWIKARLAERRAGSQPAPLTVAKRPRAGRVAPPRHH
ncbi:MAG: hypothetical protein ABI131_07915 [Nostocoides sp.]